MKSFELGSLIVHLKPNESPKVATGDIITLIVILEVFKLNVRYN